ncbi:MAG TPA: hypothetical protein VFW23_02365 [Tepidisphaeraceae bacterium]|nr:hypothetical protein [Tepidisphaeraceae bacterium]
MTLASTKGKSGAFTISLTDRSPLSKPAEIANRIAMTARQQGADYDLFQNIPTRQPLVRQPNCSRRSQVSSSMILIDNEVQLRHRNSHLCDARTELCQNQ